MQRDVHRGREVPLSPLTPETHVEDDLAGSADERLEIAESDHRVRTGRETGPGVVPVLDVAQATRGDRLDADARQGTASGCEVVEGASDQAQRAAPREQPPEVRGQRIGGLEREGAG